MNREENRRMRSTILVIRLLVLAGTSFFSSSLPVTSLFHYTGTQEGTEMGASIDHQSFFRKNTTNLEDANLSIFGSVHFLELISRSLRP
jgi:hypothetical protein